MLEIFYNDGMIKIGEYKISVGGETKKRPSIYSFIDSLTHGSQMHEEWKVIDGIFL